MLVAMTLAALALMRSVDTTNIIAGNLAFQQAATNAGDRGIEAAVTWLRSAAATSAVLRGDTLANGYLPTRADPAPTQTWDAFWVGTLAGQAVSLAADPTGNTASYIIQRMCNTVGDYNLPATGCSFAPTTCDTSSSYGAGGACWMPPAQVYYRITSRIDGPRNSVSYVQSMIAM